MPTRCAVLAWCLIFLPAFAPAQSPKDKPGPLDKVAGYKKQSLEGFTLMVSQATLDADVSGYDRKPMDVLEKELETVVGLMTAKQVETLRRLVLWIEWDEKTELTNGRNGTAVAVYYGGHQLELHRRGMQPLKAKTITLLSLKGLAEEHQPKRDSGRCVLLHEMAHAVHDQLLGSDHAGIRQAFAQATERKLYDAKQYIATNEAEFFAEATCAYFDQLHHFPKTRSELKSHDPSTFKLLEGIWGKGKATETAKPKGLLADDGSKQFDLKVKLDDLRFGDLVHGPAFDAKNLAKNVAVVGFFGNDDLPVLAKLAAIHGELAPYGAVVVAGSGQRWDASDMKKELSFREVPFPAVQSLMLRDREDPNRFVGQRPSHTLVFDADGQCVFRGSGHDAAPFARAALGRKLAASLPKETNDKNLLAACELMVTGRPILEVLPKLTPLLTSKEQGTPSKARDLIAVLTAPGQKALDEAKALVKDDKVGAYLLLEPLVATYRGTAVGDKIAAAASGLKETTAVTAELRARPALEPIVKLEASLRAQPGGFDPSNPRFRQANSAAIAQLKTAAEQLQKKHANTRTAERAAKLLKPWE